MKKILSILLVLGILLPAVFTLAEADSVSAKKDGEGPHCSTSNTTVEFLGVTETDGNYTWEYWVCQTGHRLSHWVLGLDGCVEDYIVGVGYTDNTGTTHTICSSLGTCPSPPFGVDPTSGLYGLKIETGPDDGECYTYYFVLNADLPIVVDGVEWASKFDHCPIARGTVTGPGCPCTGNIIIHKKTIGGADLGGATFTITDNATGVVVYVVTDNDPPDSNGNPGIISIQNVSCGQYDITETGVPAGYVAVTGSRQVTVESSETAEVTFYNEYCAGEIIIYKKTIGGADLGGATFTITDNATGVVVYVVTDNVSPDEDSRAGIIKITGVSCGKYDITETVVPAGYVAVTGSRQVTVESNQTAEVTFYNEYCAGEIIIRKKTSGGADLGGATFTITDNATGVVVYEVKDNDPPDSNGNPGIISIQNVSCGQYDITETGVPAGYVTVTGSQQVTVESNQTAEVTFENKQCAGEIIIHKLDYYDNTKFLSGATFTITDNATGLVAYVVTDNVSPDEDSRAGIIKITGVSCGKYNIAETGVPAGYIAVTGSQTVTVSHEQITGPVIFENKSCVKIYGYKWIDLDHNGEWDGLEPAANNWLIYLDGLYSGIHETAITGMDSWPDGYYEFTVCIEDIYQLSEKLPSGEWKQTHPVDPNTHMADVVLGYGSYGPYNFGNYKSTYKNGNGDGEEVGIEVYSVDKGALLVPWIALFALTVAIVIGGIILVKRRARS
jgi:hypothetical protein